MKTFHAILAFSLLTATAFPAFSQGEVSAQNYNDNSLRPIRNADIMYKNTIWMKVDLQEKVHEPYFAQGNEITKVIVDAVKDGVLRPYTDDQLNQRMTVSEFEENLKIPGGDIDAGEGGEWDPSWDSAGDGGAEWGSGEGWGTSSDGAGESWGAESSTAESNPASATAVVDEFFANQMSVLQFKVDVLFDRKRSRMYNDIQAVSIIIPGEYYTTGIDKVIGTFSYKELVENVFRDNPNAIWYNPQNMQEHRNLAEAFDLALYNGRIVKFANPKDQYIQDMFASDFKRALGYAQEYQYKMLEFQENLNEN